MITVHKLQSYASRRILFKGTDCLYVRPADQLKLLIANYTLSFPSEHQISLDYTVIPNGSSTLVCCFDGSQFHTQLFGTATRISEVGKEANRYQSLFIIEFQPGGLYPFLTMSQSELMNQVFSLEDLDSELSSQITRIVKTAEDLSCLFQEIDLLFMKKLDQHNFNLSSELSLASSSIIQASGTLSAETISKASYYSERHLNRIFRQQIGCGIKSFSRLVRINKAVRLIQKKQTLTETADMLKYYDPSHFIRDFQSVLGLSPTAYVKRMSDFYNEISKF